jgi:hypothetical protein
MQTTLSTYGQAMELYEKDTEIARLKSQIKILNERLIAEENRVWDLKRAKLKRVK